MFVSDAAKLFEGLGSPTLTGEAMDAFRYWRDHKVLPAIFATGGYILNSECVSSAMVSDLDRVPLPPEAGPMLAAVALDERPLRHSAPMASDEAEFERLWRGDELVAPGNHDI